MEHVKLAQVAVEVWRLGQRLDAPEPSRERLDDSLRRLVNALEEAGIRYSDPIGQPYTAGMNAEVIASQNAPASVGPLAITQVLRPAVFIDEVLTVAPQIVIGDPQQDGE